MHIPLVDLLTLSFIDSASPDLFATMLDYYLIYLQINLEEFTDLCNAIALRFQKEDTVSRSSFRSET